MNDKWSILCPMQTVNDQYIHRLAVQFAFLAALGLRRCWNKLVLSRWSCRCQICLHARHSWCLMSGFRIWCPFWLWRNDWLNEILDVWTLKKRGRLKYTEGKKQWTALESTNIPSKSHLVSLASCFNYPTRGQNYRKSLYCYFKKSGL